MHRSGHPLGAALLVALIPLILGACGGAAGPTLTSTTAPIATAQQAVASPATTAPASATTTMVSANAATNAELIAAFTAAGIPNPGSWAREVMEYRPYPASDPSFAKLRNELVKYNPPAGVVDKIVATLTP